MSQDFDPFRKNQQTNERGKIIGLVVMAVFALGIFGAIIGSACSPKPQFDKVTGCPMEKGVIAPKGHTVVLVDETDSLTPIQADFFSAQMEQMVGEMKPGELLSVYAITGDPAESRKPRIEVCKLRDGSDASRLTENEKKMRKQFDIHFKAPVEALVDTLTQKRASGAASPIMEAIQFVSVNSFKKRNVKGDRRLIIFSDMLQNTKAYSFYDAKPSIERFKQSAYAAQTKTYLPGVEVSLYYFATRPELQTNDNVEFWKAYFKNAGARLDTVIPVGK